MQAKLRQQESSFTKNNVKNIQFKALQPVPQQVATTRTFSNSLDGFGESNLPEDITYDEYGRAVIPEGRYYHGGYASKAQIQNTPVKVGSALGVLGSTFAGIGQNPNPLSTNPFASLTSAQ